MKRSFAMAGLGLGLALLSGGLAADSLPATSSVAGPTDEQLEQQHRFVQTQIAESNARRDAMLRQHYAAKLKEEVIKKEAERQGENP